MIWRRKKKVEHPPIQKVPVKPAIDFTIAIDDQETIDLVSVIASSIASGDNPASTFRVKSVRAVDMDKQAAAIIVASVLANDLPDATFKLVSIEERRSAC